MKHAIQFLHREMQRQEHNKAILVMDGAADSVADCDEAIKDCQQAIELLSRHMPAPVDDPDQLKLSFDPIDHAGLVAKAGLADDDDLDEPLPGRTCTDEEGCTSCQ